MKFIKMLMSGPRPGLAVFILSLSFTLFSCSLSSSSTDIDQQQMETIMKEKNALVMDVRTPEEVAEGVIPGASIYADYRGADFEAALAKLDTSRTYIVYCRSGARSSGAVELMKEKGFRHVYNLEGGILDWKGYLVKP